MDAVQLFDDLSVEAEALVETCVSRLTAAYFDTSTQIEAVTLRVGAERLQARVGEIVQQDIDKFELYFMRNLVYRGEAPRPRAGPKKKKTTTATAAAAVDEASLDAEVEALVTEIRQRRADNGELRRCAAALDAALRANDPGQIHVTRTKFDGWLRELTELQAQCAEHRAHLDHDR